MVKGILKGISKGFITGLLSFQGEKSINFYLIMVPLRKSIEVWYSKAQIRRIMALSKYGYKYLNRGYK